MALICEKCGNSDYKLTKGLCRDCEEERLRVIRATNIANTAVLAKDIPYYQECNYAVDIELHSITRQFNQYAEDWGGFEYNPDFQRGYVWTQEQQIAYMESFVSNVLSVQQRTITLNCPEFGNYNDKSPCELHGFVIVDGLQRVTAIQAFLKGEFKVFGKFTYEDLDNSRFSLRRKTIKVQVFAWRMKKDILEYYLLFNNGGTVHSKEEIQRVRAMLEDCKEKQ